MKVPRIKPVVVIMIAGMAIAALLWYRVRVGTWVWHLRHNSVTVGGYIVPVPKNWYPQMEDESTYLLVRLNTDDTSKTKRSKAHANILVMADKWPPRNRGVSYLAAWEASLLKKNGVRNVTTRSMTLGQETFICVGGGTLPVDIVADVKPETWDCYASGGLRLNIAATRPDMKQVWKIVSGIRPKS